MATEHEIRELTNWLGPAAATITAEQLDQLAAAVRDIVERYPDVDEQLERDAAMTAALQYLLGETRPSDAARTLIDARLAERRAYIASLQIAVMHHRVGGVDKTNAAREAGIDRMRLLKALGERPVKASERCAFQGCEEAMKLVAGGVGYCSPQHVPAELRGTLGGLR